jgi:hypothetical protein
MKPIMHAIIALFAALFLAVPAHSDALKVLARVGPWPVASQLVAYRGRIWFAASVKGVNHNSADIWSLDPSTGEARYERYLFSQDAGVPAVHKGLLYWPYEDMRGEGGWGTASVTNGIDWADVRMPGLLAFHTHAMTTWKGDLVATTSAWHGGLHFSDDNGTSWKLLADFAPRAGRFVRLAEIGTENDQLYAVARESTGPTLMQYTQGAMVDVKGWPKGEDVYSLVPHRGALYAVVARQDSHVWRVSHGKPARLTQGESGWWVRSMTSDGDRLWAIQAVRGGGAVWSSEDGNIWHKEHDFQGGRGWSVLRHDGKTFVAGEGADGRAIIWGETAPARATKTERRTARLPARKLYGDLEPVKDWPVAVARLQSSFVSDADLKQHGTGIAAKVYEAALSRPPVYFFNALINAPKPNKKVSVYGGQFSVPAAEIINWRLIWGVGLARDHSIAPSSLVAPWTRQSNGPEKWFDPLLMQLWALQWSRQNDRATTDALIDRLMNKKDPLFITSQVIGSLTAITGQRFAYDRAAWHNWWLANRNTWPR